MQTYETMDVVWDNQEKVVLKNKRVVAEFLRYAAYVSGRGLIANTFGNMVIRVPHEAYPEGVLYTKRRGISLEECGEGDVVVTSINSNSLLNGAHPPSTGHQMSRELMKHRTDANAVVHTHCNEICAYFSSDNAHPVEYVGNDTALVLGSAPKILPQDINLEATPELVKDYVAEASCFVMPNHGLVTIGRDISEAYNRHTAFVSEVKRLIITQSLYPNDPSCFLRADEVHRLYSLGERVVYGINSK